MYANFGKRLLAGIIDILILFFSEILLISISLYIILVLYITDVNQSIINIVSFTIIYPSYILLPWLYHAIQESSKRKATLGKIIFGIIVVDLYGNKLSFLIASERFFAKILTLLTFFIGFFIAAFTIQKQALHDMFVDTIVVDKDTAFEVINNQISIAQ